MDIIEFVSARRSVATTHTHTNVIEVKYKTCVIFLQYCSDIGFESITQHTHCHSVFAMLDAPVGMMPPMGTSNQYMVANFTTMSVIV